MKTWLVVIAAVAAALSVVHAQAHLDPALIGKPPVDAWPTHHGDYSGRHYSTLNQINQSNVKSLALAWSYRANTAEQGAISGGVVAKALPITLGAGAATGGLLKATPLFVNGVLYLSSPDHAWAIDAKNGREIWHFYWRTSGGEYIGNRGRGNVRRLALFRDARRVSRVVGRGNRPRTMASAGWRGKEQLLLVCGSRHHRASRHRRIER
jgi:hypothetical protein